MIGYSKKSKRNSTRNAFDEQEKRPELNLTLASKLLPKGQSVIRGAYNLTQVTKISNKEPKRAPKTFDL